MHDPYSVLLRRNKLPLSLIDEAANPHTRKVCTTTHTSTINSFPFHSSVLISSKQSLSKTLSARKHSESGLDWMSVPSKSLERLRPRLLLSRTRRRLKRQLKKVRCKGLLEQENAHLSFRHRSRTRGAVRHISGTHLPEGNLTTNLWGALQGYRLIRRRTPRSRCP